MANIAVEAFDPELEAWFEGRIVDIIDTTTVQGFRVKFKKTQE